MTIAEHLVDVPSIRTFLVCDNCGTEVVGGEPNEWSCGRWLRVLPDGWLCVYQNVDHDGKNGRHFCSYDCLGRYLDDGKYNA